MKTILKIFAYLWAVVCMLLIPVTFIGNQQFAVQLAKMPFMKVNPIYTGGEPVYTYTCDSLNITINKPVFESLIGESSQGFVQVKFSADSLPQIIAENIDYNMDGKADFKLIIDTQKSITNFEAYSKNVEKIIVSAKVKKDWVVRVKVDNEKVDKF